MAVQPAILTYPTMVFYFWLAPQVLWNDIRGIVIKQRHWQTFWGIKYVEKPLSGRSKLPAVQPLWLNFRPLPVSRIAWHTCIILQNVCTCLCFINIYSKTVYTPLDTYPTMVFYFWLAPQVLWNDLRGIVIKQRHWQTFWGIKYVDQATLRTGSCLLRS
jgi:hypothetical protein